MRRHRLAVFAAPILLLALFASPPATASGVGNASPGVQTDDAYAASAGKLGVTNVYATTQTSCYRPEIQYAANAYPYRGYIGETACPGATTVEYPGPAQQSPLTAG